MVLFDFVGSSVRSKRIFVCCKFQGKKVMRIGCTGCGELDLPSVWMKLGRAVDVIERDGKRELKMESWGNCDTDVRKLEVEISVQYVRRDLAASVQNLRAGLVQKEPSACLSDVFWTVFQLVIYYLF